MMEINLLIYLTIIINKVKEKIGNIELDNNKENLFSIIKDLKEKIRIYDSDFKKKYRIIESKQLKRNLWKK